MEIPSFHQQPRIGWHYYPDESHYRESDFTRWLPELQSVGASWLTLYAPEDFAIPEPFISGLIKANIKPIIHFHPSLVKPPQTNHLRALLDAYSSWGVRYAIFFDRPNQMNSWSPSTWAQDKLVERFLDHYLPYVEATIASGLTPILPPLEPGGNYWDLSFLSELLSGFIRRGSSAIFNHLIIGVYARAGNRPLNWGVGGPERWPSAQPYFTPANSQDHLGFRIFDWYLAISNAILNKPLPMILFGAACIPGEHTDSRFPPVSEQEHALRHTDIAKAFAGEESDLEVIPPEVIACNYSLLAALPGNPEAIQSWFSTNGRVLPAVESMKTWLGSRKISHYPKTAGPISNSNHPIAHYLLVTEDTWARKANNSAFLQAFLQKYKPTIGFLTTEAVFAKKVTIYGNEITFPNSIVDQLTDSGCLVERILEDGTLIASKY